jgi:polyhydroxybutyrate depolymerase
VDAVIREVVVSSTEIPMNRWSALAILICVAACSDASSSASSSGETKADKTGPPADYTFGGDRPVSIVRVPEGYDPAKPAPLVLVLHGYGANATVQNLYFNLPTIADAEGFFIVAPEGTTDSTGKQFWNGTDVCCDFEGRGVDDVRYLTGLVDEVQKYYSIDPKRIFVLGHSNGGAMAFRLACDAADRFAAIVDLAGPFFNDPAQCKPSTPVGVLHLHGTKDTTATYEKGAVSGTGLHPNAPGRGMPGAVATVTAWASYDKCAPTPDTSAPPIELDNDIAGPETKISKYTGCAANGGVELWSLEGSGHVPLNLTKDLPKLIYDFMSRHAKP